MGRSVDRILSLWWAQDIKSKFGCFDATSAMQNSSGANMVFSVCTCFILVFHRRAVLAHCSIHCDSPYVSNSFASFCSDSGKKYHQSLKNHSFVQLQFRSKICHQHNLFTTFLKKRVFLSTSCTLGAQLFVYIEQYVWALLMLQACSLIKTKLRTIQRIQTVSSVRLLDWKRMRCWISLSPMRCRTIFYIDTIVRGCRHNRTYPAALAFVYEKTKVRIWVR